MSLANLPEPVEFDVVALYGGFAVVHDAGALVFDDWRAERLFLDKVREEFERVFH